MREAVRMIQEYGYDVDNFTTFEDWTAIATVLGAEEANRLFDYETWA